MRHYPAVTILLVEDNPDHAELTLKALRDGNMVNHIAWAKHGEEALDYLYQRGVYGDGAHAPRPGLILLDIRLPRIDGREVLRQIKQDAGLKEIPVVMLTTSDEEIDVHECYRAGANSFVTKPVQFTDFVQKVKAVKLYWAVTNHGVCA
ncbi:MAG: response regulator [Candidatus Rokubacteria bacterium]|nr:response regulator [Candidatus Rokubacteria bacterium]